MSAVVNQVGFVRVVDLYNDPQNKETLYGYMFEQDFLREYGGAKQKFTLYSQNYYSNESIDSSRSHFESYFYITERYLRPNKYFSDDQLMISTTKMTPYNLIQEVCNPNIKLDLLIHLLMYKFKKIVKMTADQYGNSKIRLEIYCADGGSGYYYIDWDSQYYGGDWSNQEIYKNWEYYDYQRNTMFPSTLGNQNEETIWKFLEVFNIVA